MTLQCSPHRGSGCISPAAKSASLPDAEALLTEVADLSPRLTLTKHDLYAEAEVAAATGVDKVPALVLRGADGEPDGRVRFFGLPSGYEFATWWTRVAVSQAGMTGVRAGIDGLARGMAGIYASKAGVAYSYVTISGPEGYVVAYAMDNLRLGRTVIADSVNPVPREAVVAQPTVMTVRGPVLADELGITLAHEHLFFRLDCYYSQAADDPDGSFAVRYA